METNKIPTAESILFDNCTTKEHHIVSTISMFDQHIVEAMIKFAKIHCKEALRQASEKAECCEGSIIDLGFEIISATVNKESILNTYNLDDIK